MKPRYVAALIAALVCRGGAVAHEMAPAPANQVMSGCRLWLTPNNDFKNNDLKELMMLARCLGAISELLYETPGVCAPPFTQLNEGIRVVIAYIDVRPARLHENFDVLAREALEDAWPCR